MTIGASNFLEEFAKDVQKVAFPDVRLCPTSGCLETLTGKQIYCSDKCRKRNARASGYSNVGETTTLRLSSRRSKKLGKYLSRFKFNERPYDIESGRMKTLESGRAKALTVDELHALWVTYPDLLRVLLGIRI
jgi:hypothetical protein